MPERFALYFAPPADSALSMRAALWLGRDPAGGAIDPPAIGSIDTAHRIAISTSARRYGFHATIKAPFALAPGVTRTDLESALAGFAEAHSGPSIGRLQLTLIYGFLALTPVEQTSELTDFVQQVVEAFEPFRAPLTADDRAKRIETGHLNARNIELLDRFGYPYVMEQFRYHMTLTDSLPAAELQPVMAAAQKWFGDTLAVPYTLDRLVLFHEPAPGAPFIRAGDFRFKTRVTADA